MNVLQLTTVIVMASSAKKNRTPKVKTLNFRGWSFSYNFTIETDDEAQISIRKHKICSEHFSFSSSIVGLKKCLQILTP